MKAFNQVKRLMNQDRDLKLSMIRREMMTDTVQFGIKLFTYNISGSQALKTDLCRSFLDLVNHGFRVFASFRSTYKPDEHFNYGYNRARHLTIMAPGYLFITSGIYNIANPVIWGFSYFPAITYLTLNPFTLSAIAFASIGEFYLYYRNLGDISHDKSMSFFKRLKERKKLSLSILKNSNTAGHIQDTVVIENILSVTSATVPIVTSVFAYTTGLFWMDLVGQFVNGGIQIFLGYRITKENTEILMGRSLKKEDCERIIEIIKARKEVVDVENLKNIWSIDQLRVSAEIQLNKRVISQYILKLMEKDIKDIDVDQNELRILLSKFTYYTLSRSTEICKETEERVKEVYEFANMIDIEKGDCSESPERRRRVEKVMNEMANQDNK